MSDTDKVYAHLRPTDAVDFVVVDGPLAGRRGYTIPHRTARVAGNVNAGLYGDDWLYEFREGEIRSDAQEIR